MSKHYMIGYIVSALEHFFTSYEYTLQIINK